jgi:predicted MPP superfamily phosphohydrolase
MRRRDFLKNIFSFIVFSSIVDFSGDLFAQGTTLYQRSIENLENRLKFASDEYFSFIVMGDSHRNDKVLKRAFELARSFDPVFILYTGDMTNDGYEFEYKDFLRMCKMLGDLPIFPIIGNHEIRHSDKALYEKYMGPLNYSLGINRLNMKIVCLDNSDGILNSDQLQFLSKELSDESKMLFVAMHEPPSYKKWWIHSYYHGNKEAMDIVSEHKVKAVFQGHIHLYDHQIIKGIDYYISGGAGGKIFPLNFGDPSYNILHVKVIKGNISVKELQLRNFFNIEKLIS